MYYQRVLVMALSQEYVINTRTDGDYRLRHVEVGMFDRDEDGTQLEGFRIPLNVAILKDMPFLHREAAVADSLTYTVFLVHKQKVKWYEKSFFKIFIVIVAIILIIVVAYFGLYNIAAGIASFIVGGGTASALLVFVIYVVLAFALGTIIGMAAQSIGGIWGIVFAIVASIYLAGSTTGTLTGSWGNVINYINAASPYLTGAQQIYAYYVSDQLKRDWETFMLTAREKQQQLDDAWADLDTPDWLDPMMLIRAQDFRYENPQQYLARTKNTNPGVTANNAVHNFVRIALTLPENPMEKDAIREMYEGFQRQLGAV